MIGPAIVGVLITTIGSGRIYLIDAAWSAVLVGSLSRLRVDE